MVVGGVCFRNVILQRDERRWGAFGWSTGRQMVEMDVDMYAKGGLGSVMGTSVIKGCRAGAELCAKEEVPSTDCCTFLGSESTSALPSRNDLWPNYVSLFSTITWISICAFVIFVMA